MGAIITKLGLEKIAQATVDTPLRIEKFAVGEGMTSTNKIKDSDGGGVNITPNEDMTSLVNEKYRDVINDKYANNNNTVFESVLRANAPISEGFYIRELGLFDEDGDLIVITDVPVQYRPATAEGNIVTELLFNISIQVQNADVIEIKLNEQVFATTDSLDRLLKRVEKLEEDKENLINASIGIEKWFNTDNKYKDQNIVQRGIKTYALMDENNILQIADYPLLFKNIGAVDRGEGTFAMTNFYDGTVRHIAKGEERELGSFEDCAVQNAAFGFNAVWDSAVAGYNAAFLRDIKGGRARTGRAHALGSNSNLLQSNSDTGYSIGVDFSLQQAGVKTDNKETRMKNTAGQWYVLAKINI